LGSIPSSDLLGLDTEFVEDVREVLRDLLARVEHGRVREDLNGPLLDASVRTDGLELADERAGVDAGVALGHDDVVWGDLAGADGRGRLRGFQFLIQRERVAVGADEPDLSGDVLGQVLEAVVDFLEGADEQGVPGDAKLRGTVQVTAHVLELSGRNPGDVDDADRVVGLDHLDDGVDLSLFPLRDGLCLALAFGAHIRPPPRRGPSSSSRRWCRR